MELKYKKELISNPLEILRKAGYSPFRDPKTHEESFIIRLTTEFYPRFHLYLNDRGSEISFSLHLDQKKPSYGSGKAHGGEYEGTTVEKEMERLKKWIHFIAKIPTELPKQTFVQQSKETTNNQIDLKTSTKKNIAKKKFGGIFG